MLHHARRVSGLVAIFGLVVIGLAAPARAVLTPFTSRAVFAAAAGNTTLVTFENFASGTVITNQLAPQGIAQVSGVDSSATPRNVTVTSDTQLPFPMFTPGTLPSETNFLSVDMSAPAFATGRITFGFPQVPKTAIGAFIADGAPTGNFSIELFNGANSLGSITVGPRTLPDSFVGVTSTQPFTSAVFFANSTVDSWGLDNLEFNAVPEPACMAGVLLGAMVMFGRRGR